MPSVNSRQALIDYCLRRLGFPVIEINIDQDQIDDRMFVNGLQFLIKEGIIPI